MTNVQQDDHVALLRAAGLRSTPQRLAIAGEIFSRSHPTVGEVFTAVQQKFPTIGLATIYNTLRSMAEKGLVRELPFADAIRYDANISEHVNLVCTDCGKIEDSEDCDDLIVAIRKRVSSGFTPQNERVDLYGVCGDCLKPLKQPARRRRAL